MTEAARVLEEWRKGERLLQVLPPDAPERDEVEAYVAEMRTLYRHVTSETIPEAQARLDYARCQVENARATLARIAARYGNGDEVQRAG